MQFSVAGNSDLWLQDLERHSLRRLTFRAGIDRNPVWSPDGVRLVFSHSSGYGWDLSQQVAASSGNEEVLVHGGGTILATDWSADGRLVLYNRTEGKTRSDLWLLPFEGDRKPVPYLQTPFNEEDGHFAPGQARPRWVAYQSDESGRNEIYVQALPATGPKYPVSTTGGTNARWRQDGSELYYRSADGKIMAVPITLGETPKVGNPIALFTNSTMDAFEPSRDGQRFLVNLPAGGGTGPSNSITVWTNWEMGLRKQ